MDIEKVISNLCHSPRLGNMLQKVIFHLLCSLSTDKMLSSWTEHPKVVETYFFYVIDDKECVKHFCLEKLTENHPSTIQGVGDGPSSMWLSSP